MTTDIGILMPNGTAKSQFTPLSTNFKSSIVTPDVSHNIPGINKTIKIQPASSKTKKNIFQALSEFVGWFPILFKLEN